MWCYFDLQEIVTSPIEDNISSESFKQEPAVAKFKVIQTLKFHSLQ